MDRNRHMASPTISPSTSRAVQPAAAYGSIAGTTQMNAFLDRARADRNAAMTAYVGVVRDSKPLTDGRTGLVMDTARGDLVVIVAADASEHGADLFIPGRLIRVTGTIRDDRGGTHLRAVDIRNGIAPARHDLADVRVVEYVETVPVRPVLRLAVVNGIAR